MRVRKPLVALATTAAAATLATAAFAAWNASGTGSGYAEATNAVALHTVSATTTAQLYPGGDGDLVIKIANPNPYPVTVTDVVRTGAIDSDATAACDASTGVTFADQTALSLAVPANSEGTEHTLVGRVHMSNASHNDCQGAVFTLPVTLTGVSAATS